jgi:hypothetical protein
MQQFARRSSLLRDIARHTFVTGYWFGATHRSYLRGTGNLKSLLDPWRWDWHVAPKRRLLTTDIHRATSQKSGDLKCATAEVWDFAYETVIACLSSVSFFCVLVAHFLGAFAALRKATISFVMSVFLSIHLFARNNSASTRGIFFKFYIWVSEIIRTIWWKSRKKILYAREAYVSMISTVGPRWQIL